jgi:hypothetical protein
MERRNHVLDFAPALVTRGAEYVGVILRRQMGRQQSNRCQRNQALAQHLEDDGKAA